MSEPKYSEEYLSLIVDTFPNTYIAPSPTHGFGLFASCDIPKGTILGTMDGQLMSWDDYHRIVANTDKGKMFLEWNCVAPDKLLVRPFRTKYSFINHSRTPNAEIKHQPYMVIALEDIPKDAEILTDYRIEPLPRAYLEGHGATYL